MIRLVRTDSDNKDFQSLVKLLDKGLEVTDGNDYEFFAQYNKLDSIKNAVVAYENDTAVGCGAFKAYDENTVEIKRMFVKAEFRGKDIAGKILSELETWAKELGFTDAILETGCMLTSAIHLYENKSGYRRIPKYGQYIGVEASVCMAKKL
ncbi:MAG TPA: GNAT family N-acetyltransferase [Flavobacterium sp.]|nr:GNAT family N-acetyltransferase [Flavobacterium sp.]